MGIRLLQSCDVRHRILLSLVAKLPISLNRFIQEDINTYYLVNGVLQKTYVVGQLPDILNYNLSGEERGKSASQLFSQALRKVRPPQQHQDITTCCNSPSQIRPGHCCETGLLSRD